MSESLCQRVVREMVAAAFADAVVRFGGGREKTYALTTSSGATTINLTSGNTQTLTLTQDTTLTLSGATAGTSCTLSLYLLQDGTGGWEVTWPAGVLWPGGTTPTLSAAGDSLDLVVLETLDGGTTWIATASLDFR